MKRSVLGAVGIAVLAAVAGCVDPSAVQRTGSAALSSVPFEATFSTPADFYDRFDYGFTGQNPLAYGDGITHFHGDHNLACEAPTTSRDVAFRGTADALDFSQLFWHCAPGGDPAKGHIMTGVNTVGYNISWFSPKPLFSNVSRVCWDINLTELSRRKWTQVVFVSAEDATRYPAGTVTIGPGGVARGTGGFDLGYTAPDFRQKDPNAGIFPQGGTLAGFKSTAGDASWFQNQDTWTTEYQGPGNLLPGITDKAARFKHCLSNEPGNIVRLTQQTPTGTRTFDMQGQIPQHPVRVVFQDDNYNPGKDDFFKADVLTWHWDNIQIEAGSAVELAATPGPVASAANDQPATPSPSPGEAALGPQQGPLTGANSAAPNANLGVANLVGLVLAILGLVALLVVWPGRSVRLARRENSLRPEDPNEEA